MNRRTAVKQLTTLTAASAVAPNLFCQTPAPEKMGVALVGLGNYATRQLAPALQQTSNCYLSGIITGTPAKAKKWKVDYDIPAANVYNYETFDKLRTNDAIDIVYIVLPNFMHVEYTIRALEAGKHVICEKPMGMNSEECERMIAAAKANNRKLQIGYRLYYQSHHLAARNYALSDEGGKVKMIESSMGFPMARPGMWRIEKAKGGGGAIMDLGVYCIQAVRRAVGEDPIRVTAQAFTQNKELFKDIYETYLWQLEFPSGIRSNTTTTFTSYVDRLHIAKQSGWVQLEPCFNAAATLKLEGALADMDIENPPLQQIAQMEAFVENIRQDTPVLASGREGWKDLRIIEAIFAAIASGKSEPINWK